MLRHESDNMDFVEAPEIMMLRHESGDVDLAEDSEIHIDAKT